jgi:hypothetical protein
MKNLDQPRMGEDKGTDMEYALFLAGHINNPCKTLDGDNVGETYIREARKSLETMTNPLAIETLQDAIDNYSNN